MSEWIKWSPSHLWNFLRVEFYTNLFYPSLIALPSIPSVCRSNPLPIPSTCLYLVRSLSGARYSSPCVPPTQHPHFFQLSHVFKSWGPSLYLSLTSKHISVLLIFHLKVWSTEWNIASQFFKWQMESKQSASWAFDEHLVFSTFLTAAPFCAAQRGRDTQAHTHPPT